MTTLQKISHATDRHIPSPTGSLGHLPAAGEERAWECGWAVHAPASKAPHCTGQIQRKEEKRPQTPL